MKILVPKCVIVEIQRLNQSYTIQNKSPVAHGQATEASIP